MKRKKKRIRTRWNIKVLVIYAVTLFFIIFGIKTAVVKVAGLIQSRTEEQYQEDIEEAAEHGNDRAETALDVFAYKVAKRIGAYAAAMNGVDAIVFTAGLGENSGTTRRAICDYLGFLGVHIDSYNNSLRGKALEISATDSRVRVFVIPTNEELVIARDTKELLDK